LLEKLLNYKRYLIMVKKDIVEFIETIYTLKEIKRAGWVKRKIKNPLL